MVVDARFANGHQETMVRRGLSPDLAADHRNINELDYIQHKAPNPRHANKQHDSLITTSQDSTPMNIGSPLTSRMQEADN